MGDRPFRVEMIYEGCCPMCSAPLERREKDGWCSACNLGFAAKRLAPGEGEVSMTIEVEDGASGAFRFTNARATFTSKLPPGDASYPHPPTMGAQ